MTTKAGLIKNKNQERLQQGINEVASMMKDHEIRRVRLEEKLSLQSRKKVLEKHMNICYTRWFRFASQNAKSKRDKTKKSTSTNIIIHVTKLSTLGIFYRKLHNWGWYKLSIPRNRTILEDLQTAVSCNKELRSEVESLEIVQKEAQRNAETLTENFNNIKQELGTEKRGRRSSEISFQKELLAARELHSKQQYNEAAVEQALNDVIEQKVSNIQSRQVRYTSPQERSLVDVRLSSPKYQEPHTVALVDVPRHLNTNAGLLVGSPMLRPHSNSPSYSTERMIKSLQRHRKQSWKQKVSAVR